MNPSRAGHEGTVSATTLILYALLTGLLGSMSCDGSTAGGPAGPVSDASGLACAEPRVAFGEVWAGTVLEHEFELRCLRDGVRVEGVRADCGCTVANLQSESPDGQRVDYKDARPIPSGTRLFLQAEYDTRGKRGHAPRTVTVHTTEGRLELLLDASVLPWLEVTPEQIDLPQTSQDEVLQRTLRVSSTDGGVFRLSHSGRGVPEQIAVQTNPIDGDAYGRSSAWEVALTFGPDLPLGLRGYPIELVAEPGPDTSWNTGDSTTLTVSPLVTVRVVGQVSLSPSSVSFGRLTAGQTIARTIRLRCHDPEFTLGEPELRLLPVRPVLDAALQEVAEVTASAVSGENAWDIQILLSDFEGRFEGTFLGRLVVVTGHPKQPEVEATINGFLPFSAGGSLEGPR